MKNALAWTMAGLLALVLTAGLILGGWQAGWWFRTQNVNRNAHLFQHSYGAQTGYEEQLRTNIGDVTQIDVEIAAPHTTEAEIAALRAQRAAVVNQACDLASKITRALPTDEARFVTTNCQGATP